MKDKSSLLFILVLIVLCSIGVGAQTADDNFKQGNQQYQQKDFQAAIKSYTECIRLKPTSDGCYYNRGLAHYGQGNYEASANDFTEVLKSNPQNAEAYVRRGIANTKLEKYESVVADYEAALKIQPNDDLLKKTLGDVKALIAAKKDLDTAKQEYASAQEKQGAIARNFLTQGNQQMGQKDYDGSIASYTKCIEAEPLNLECYNNRGLANGIKQNYDAAILDFTTILLIKPSPEIYFRRAVTYRDKKDDTAAIKDFTEAIKLAPQDANLLMERGATYIYKGDYPAAIADLNQALKINPQEAKYYFVRGYAYEASGNKDSAITDYKKALQINPEFAEAKKRLQALGNQP